MREREGKWLLRVVSLLIASALWYVLAAEKRELESEKQLDSSVTYNTPKGVVLLDRVSEVRVLVRGRNREIRRLRPFDVDVLVDVPTTQKGSLAVTLTADNVDLPSDNLTVVSIEPKSITLRIDSEAHKRVPVEIDLAGEPAAGAIVVRKTVQPNEVTVAGPASLMGSFKRVTTTRVGLDGHAISFEREVSLVTSDPLIRVVEPLNVTLSVELEQPANPRGDG